MTTCSRTPAEVSTAGRDRHVARVRYLTAVKVNRVVKVRRCRLGRVTLRARYSRVAKVLVVSLVRRVVGVTDRAVAACRTPHRRLDCGSLTAVVTSRSRTGVRRRVTEVHAAGKVNTAVLVLRISTVIDVAIRTTDTVDTERPSH